MSPWPPRSNGNYYHNHHLAVEELPSLENDVELRNSIINNKLNIKNKNNFDPSNRINQRK